MALTSPTSRVIASNSVTPVPGPRSVERIDPVFIRPFRSISLQELSVRPRSTRSSDRSIYLRSIWQRYKQLITTGDINLLEENPHYQAVMRQRFFDPSVLSHIEQALYSFINDGNNDEPTQFDVTTGVLTREMIRHVFQFSRQIGSDSAYGMAYTFGPSIVSGSSTPGESMETNGNKIHESMVVKYSNSSTDQEEIYHEWAVGRILNQIRSKIPNFVYTLGCLVGCSAPISQSKILSSKGAVSSWCSISDRDGRTPYLLLERIYDPQSFFDYFYARDEPDTLVNFVLQVALSLTLANQRFKFTHYDLHYGNILCWNIPDIAQGETVAIPYPFMGSTLYVRTNKIASIIDMGFARAEHDGYKYHNSIPEFRCYDRFYGLTDIFRLVVHTYSLLRNYEKYALLPYLAKMIKFFTDEDPNKVVSVCEQVKIYNLPPNNEVEQLDCSFFVAFLLQTFSIDFVSWEQPSHVRVVGCEGTDLCIKSGISPVNPSKSVDSLDAVILYYLYTNKGVRSFSPDQIERAIIHSNGVIQQQLIGLDDEVTRFTTQFGSGQSNTKIHILDQAQMEQLYHRVITLFNIYDRYHYMLTYIRAIYYLNGIYFPTDQAPFHQFLVEVRTKYEPFFDQWKMVIHHELYSLWDQSLSSGVDAVLRHRKREKLAELIGWYHRSCRHIIDICVAPKLDIVPLSQSHSPSPVQS